MPLSLLFLTPYLLACFPLLDLYDHNVFFVNFIELLLLLLAMIAGVFIFLLVLQILFRNWIKTIAFGSYSLLFFFYFHHVLELFNQFTKTYFGSIFIRLRYILIVLLFFFVWLFIKTLRKKKTATFPLSILLIIFGTLSTFTCISIAKKLITKQQCIAASTHIQDTQYQKLLTQLQTSNTKEKPNIYYIILDMYTSSDSLKQNFGYDNSWFLEKLKKLGFQITDTSRSNYSCTMPSLSATLNMHYHTTDAEFISLIARNNVFRLFKDLEYTIVTIPSYMRITQSLVEDPSSHGLPTSIKHALTMLSSTFDVIFNFIKHKTFLLYLPSISLYEIQRRRRVIHAQCEQLKQISSLSGPKFVFCHILCPHPPFVLATKSNNIEKVFDMPFEKGYKKQVDVISKQIEKTIAYILKNETIEPIIILQGDHGTIQPGDDLFLGINNKIETIDTELVKQDFAILNAWHIPNKKFTLPTQDFSPINNFRLILNNYFGTNLGILKTQSSLFYSNPRTNKPQFMNVDFVFNPTFSHQTISVKPLTGDNI